MEKRGQAELKRAKMGMDTVSSTVWRRKKKWYDEKRRSWM